jgi:hypothetical protein
MTAPAKPTPEQIRAGAPFLYEVVGWGSTPEEALRWAQAWQGRPENMGPGSALYGRTVPVEWGTPYLARPEYAHLRGYAAAADEWRVPVLWQVAS